MEPLTELETEMLGALELVIGSLEYHKDDEVNAEVMRRVQALVRKIKETRKVR